MKTTSARNMCKTVQCLTVNGYKPQLEAGKVDDGLNIFRGYKNISSLNIFNCADMQFEAYKQCFRNNHGITSFTCDDLSFPLGLLSSLRNLERLMISYHSLYISPDVLSSLSSLRHLTLICGDDSVELNNAIDKLDSSHMEELVLVDVPINQRTFEIVKSMQSLKMLSISSLNYQPLPSPMDLPTKLKQLKLEGFHIDNGQIGSLVERLPHLQHMSLKDCEVRQYGTWVNNFDEMAGVMLDELSVNHLHRQLNVSIKAKHDPSKIIVSVGRIRISNYVKNKNLFQISYPGMNGLVPTAVQK